MNAHIYISAFVILLVVAVVWWIVVQSSMDIKTNPSPQTVAQYKYNNVVNAMASHAPTETFRPRCDCTFKGIRNCNGDECTGACFLHLDVEDTVIKVEVNRPPGASPMFRRSQVCERLSHESNVPVKFIKGKLDSTVQLDWDKLPEFINYGDKSE
jgi:hypothetical protein